MPTLQDVIVARHKFEKEFGRVPSFLFINEVGYADLFLELSPVTYNEIAYPSIGRIGGGQVLYVPDLHLSFYWQDAVVLAKAVSLAVNIKVDYLKVYDPKVDVPPVYAGNWGQKIPLPYVGVAEKIHELPLCVIEAYKEYLCN